MNPGNGLHYRGKPHGVGADRFQKPCFRRRFKTWPQQTGINPGVQLNMFLCSGLNGTSSQIRVIYPSHIRKPKAKGILVRTYKGIFSGEVDMVPDEHNVSGIEIQIDAAGCIGKDKHRHPKGLKQSYRKRDKLWGIPFIQMYPALENKNIPAVKTALDKTPLVAVHCGLRKMGEPRIGKHLMDHKVGQAI